MRNTTRPTVLAPESIHIALLAGVSGGCQPKCPAPAAASSAATVNNFQLINLGCCGGTPPTPPVQSAPSEPEVETSVSYSAAGVTARA